MTAREPANNKNEQPELERDIFNYYIFNANKFYTIVFITSLLRIENGGVCVSSIIKVLAEMLKTSKKARWGSIKNRAENTMTFNKF
ncbi:hypothetical protein B4916_08720 [Yersinia intermedia]|nr:hypothetical protein B4916_08720 [Yersinia intermedia]